MSIYETVVEEFGNAPPYANKRDFTRYFGYAGGTSLGEFATIDEAKKAGAVLTEPTFDEVGFKAAQQAYIDHGSAIMAEWDKRLRALHSEVTPEVFDLCYSEAYDRGHSYGYNEVENLLDSQIDFAHSVIAAMKKA